MYNVYCIHFILQGELLLHRFFYGAYHLDNKLVIIIIIIIVSKINMRLLTILADNLTFELQTLPVALIILMLIKTYFKVLVTFKTYELVLESKQRTLT